MADVSRCPICQVPVLPDDAACWQCGAPLGGKERVRVVDSGRSEQEDERRRRLVYGILTLAVFLLALLVINRLGSAPLLQTALADALPADWRYYTPADHSFITPLPDSWQRTTPADGLALAQLAADYPLVWQVLAPWATAVDDLELRLIAREADDHLQLAPPEDATPFLIVARSRRLGSATRPQLESLLPRAAGLLDTTDVENFDKSYWLLRWELDGWRCEQQLVSDQIALYLQVLCTPDGKLGRYQQQNARIADGFQLLLR